MVGVGAFVSGTLLALACCAWFGSFPHPYAAHTANIDAAALERLPPFPPDLTGVFEPNALLATHAQRLFEGRVSGAESVAPWRGVRKDWERYHFLRTPFWCQRARGNYFHHNHPRPANPETEKRNGKNCV